jgi:hypothetical protein
MGRSLELYFIDDRPDGMLTAEVFNWTGHVLCSPRTRLVDALKRPEASQTGVYILTGERDGEPLAYIGESENISDRIRSHDANKDWWNRVVFISTSANALNKAHAKYLEARLVETARKVNRTALENGNTPPRSSLSEAGRANMEAFLDQLLMVLPAIGIDVFVEYTRAKMQSELQTEDSTSPAFELKVKKYKINATATLVDGDFLVDKGSYARLKWEGEGNWDASYAKLHQELLNKGVLKPEGDLCVFTSDYAFRSTSAAAAVVTGRPTSGPASWRLLKDGRTYKEWEADQISNA